MDKEKQEGWALERISRRRALKRVAAGAAVAWSAPVLTSLSAPAFAQYGPCPVPPPCGPACASSGFRDCQVAPPCICVETVEGECACVQFNIGTVACSATTDCGAGAVCVNETCLGDFCQPLCAGLAPSHGTISGVNLR
jgi:hypothetical protein